MDIKELRSQSLVALQRTLAEAERRLQELRFEISSGQLRDIREVREVRKRIAQIKTLMKENQLSDSNETQSDSTEETK